MKYKSITIVGLGLIGGSLLKALQGFEDAILYGVDTNKAVVEKAQELQLISNGNMSQDEIILSSDVTFICLPPNETINFLNHHSFKKNSLVTDVCGIKQEIYRQIERRDFDFIGGHPMAGKESSGFSASDEQLFYNAYYLLTPDKKNNPEHIELLKQIALYIGCKDVIITTPEEHDRIIAYTSQLMHIVAVALCDNPLLEASSQFSAGSLRDCTRVAQLDPFLWSQLFLLNKDELVTCIEKFISSLHHLKSMIQTEREADLKLFLKSASERKMKFLLEK